MKRKSLWQVLIPGAFLLSLLAACGGGGGGGDGGGGDGGGSGGGGGPTPLATGAFTKTIDLGSTNFTGLLAEATYVHYQYLYLASNINGAGRITGLAIKYRSAMATAVTCPNATIKLSHSNLANLTGTFASSLGTGQGSQTTVLNNAPMMFPAGLAGSWQTISLATPFDYNGKDNLIVDVERTSACSGIVYDDVNTAWPYTAGVYTFTNGSATGTTATWAANGRLVFAGGDDRVVYGGSTPNGIPFAQSNIPEFRHAQLLYHASEIGGSGPITGIAFVVGQLTTANDYVVTVRLGHTTSSTLAVSFAANFNSGAPVTVASGLSFKVPAGIPVGRPIWIPLSGAFSYNGTDNLIIDIEVTGPFAASTFMRTHGALTGRRLFAAVGAATGTVDNQGGYDTYFRFHGASMDVLPAGAGDAVSNQAFGRPGGGQIQSLYRSVYLGTGGTITSVAVRLSGTPAATTVPNYRIYMGHTAKTALNTSDSYASNMDENALVYNGTLTVPAGLRYGDWITIPLQTPFTYDSGRNLVVLLTGDSPGVDNWAHLHTGDPEFTARTAGRDDNSVGTAGTPQWGYSGALSVRFGVQK